MIDALNTVLHSGTEFSTELGVHIRKVLTPFCCTITEYSLVTFRADLIAGLTVATIIIPNAMAYALLVGLPPQMGLYATLASAGVGALWGSSAFVVTGAVGIVSLLTLTAILPFAPMGTPAFITLAIMLALAVGVVQLFAGVFRFGYLARLIPHTVLIGFSSAGALIIASTQVPTFLGITIIQQEHVIDTIIGIVTHVPQTHIPTLLLGVVTLVFLFGMRRVAPFLPAALIVLVLGVVGDAVFSLDSFGIARIGDIPSRLPAFDIPNISFTNITTLLSSAFVIALVGFMETSAIARALTRSSKEKLDADRELVGQGLANISAGIVGGFPVSGSFSASAVNVHAGAKTPLSSVFVSATILVAILFLAPILGLIPRVILAAIVIAAVAHMVDLKKIQDTFAVSPSGGSIAAATFVLAFLFKPDTAVIAGVVIALVVLVHRIMFADVAEVGFDHEWSDTLRRAGTKDSIETFPALLVVRVDRSILYANSERIMERMRALLAEHVMRGDMPKLFVIHFAGVNEIDFSGLEDLGTFFTELREKGIDVCIIYAKTRERDILKQAYHLVGPIAFLHSIEELKERYTLVTGTTRS